ncbi:unnamed protein product, partial [Arabidopsis halleri]
FDIFLTPSQKEQKQSVSFHSTPPVKSKSSPVEWLSGSNTYLLSLLSTLMVSLLPPSKNSPASQALNRTVKFVTQFFNLSTNRSSLRRLTPVVQSFYTKSVSS